VTIALIAPDNADSQHPSRAEWTAQARAIRELSDNQIQTIGQATNFDPIEPRCSNCDRFQHVRNVFWEVSDGQGGLTDILVKRPERTLEIYEVRQLSSSRNPRTD
jgi:hypothetical protein